jgi:inhibitor of KinA sporulation pathway (predicted exonuclease)
MHYIIFDIATTGDELNSLDSETIEIGAIKLTDDFVIIGTFEQTIKPVQRPMLTAYCKTKTNLTQEIVNSAPLFPIVFTRFRQWSEEDAIFVSWDFFVKKQLLTDASFFGMNADWLEPHHVGLANVYQSLTNQIEPIDFFLALQKEGVAYQGMTKRSLDRAINLSRIFLRYASYFIKNN